MSLPNAVSWRQTGANDVCDSPLDAFPGTTAKCNVNPAFGIPVIVETATVTVVKVASPTSVPETGGTVHYTVTVTNSASFVDLTIDSISDDTYGVLTTLPACGAGEPPPTCTPSGTTSCASLVGTTLTPSGSASCGFDAFVTGNSGDAITDIAEVCGHDNAGHTGLCGHDDASVTITDAFTEPTVDKTAQSAANCRLDVTYQVVVSNNSTVDTLTVNSLTDDKFGDVTTVHAAGGGFEEVVTACTLSKNPIPSSDSANCTFVGRITSNSCSFTHTDTVTANVTDDDGVTSTPSNDATVTVSTTFP